MRNVIATMAVLMLGAAPLRAVQDVSQPQADQTQT